MMFLRLSDVKVEFPLYQGSNRSLKKTMLANTPFGELKKDATNRVNVVALHDLNLDIETWRPPRHYRSKWSGEDNPSQSSCWNLSARSGPNPLIGTGHRVADNFGRIECGGNRAREHYSSWNVYGYSSARNACPY